MREADLVRAIRSDTGLSIRAIAQAAGVAASTVHRIEQGELHPTMVTLERIAEAAGFRLSVERQLDYATSIVGLARSIGADVAGGDLTWPIRKAAELAHRFRRADPGTRRRMITAEPPQTGDPRWDAFVAAFAEWLAVEAGAPVPSWAHHDDRYLRRGWWVTPMVSMHAWEYAGSPASFQSHGVYLHRDSLTNV
ncbi:MAG: helix-turn-helix domain-containing protein [Gemmatimonadales bacterium]